MLLTTTRGRMLAALLALLSGLAADGCSKPKPMLPYSLETPPLILVPASYGDVTDGRARFREIFVKTRWDHGETLPDDRAVEHALVRLADEPEPTGRPVEVGRARLSMRFVFIPGLFGACVIDSLGPFPYGRRHIEEYGYGTDQIVVSGRSGSAHNGTEIRDALLEMDIAPDEKIILVGYSKGTVDALHAVVDHPEVRERVTAIVSIAGAVGGSPLADELEADTENFVMTLAVPGCPRGDGLAIDSLKRSTRQKWMAEHRLPEAVRYYSIGAFADREQISSFLQSNYDKLAMLDPRNDSQVLFSDAIIPGSTLLGFAYADHWTIALPFSRDMPLVAATALDRSEYPREILLESIARFVEEDLLENPQEATERRSDGATKGG